MSTNKDKEKILPLGVDEEIWNKKEPFKKSEETQSWDNKTNDAYSNLNKVTNEQIISNNTQKNLNKNFKVPSAVTEADAYLSEQLKKIQSGKTSYTDDIKNMMDKILNREKFSYDVDQDPLFQQALASAMNSGKQAMQDTIGQASALTGGYGSSYATSVGNQSYNAYIEDAYDNLPQYYQMAWNQYQAEGDEMYRQLGMFTDADDREYNRNLTGYEVTSQYRNRAYDEAYNMYRDTKNDAFNMANLEMNVHGQKVSDAYNLYGATSNQADKLYEREYNSWLDNINMIYKDIEILRDDAWKNKEFDEKVREFEMTYNQNEDHFTRNLNFQASENAKNRAVKSTSGGNSKLSNGASKTQMATYKQKALDLLKDDEDGGMNAVNQYLSSLNLSPEELTEIATYLFGDEESGETGAAGLPSIYSGEFVKTEDTYNNLGGWIKGIFGGGNSGNETDVDWNDKVEYNGIPMTLKELEREMKAKGVPDYLIEEKLLELTNTRIK